MNKENGIIPNRNGCSKTNKGIHQKGTFIKVNLIIFDENPQEITMRSAYEHEVITEVMEAVETTDLMDLVVFNDDVNTFDHVINTLIKVCNHSKEQAEQCTILIHYKGKCAVKNGSFDFLRPMRESICEAGIDARIL
jgi:ATP-dependent Clp protease adaptor protein ClpS